MSDIEHEKMASTTEQKTGTESPPHDIMGGEDAQHARGKPWMYKSVRLGPVTIPAYNTPQFQVFFVALVCV